MTSDSRWMPRASVTAKIASISRIVTTSSTQAHLAGARRDLPPRLVLDDDAGRAPRALAARLRLTGDQDLGGAGRRHGAAHPVEERRYLGVQLLGRQEARGIDRHDQRAVRELSL